MKLTEELYKEVDSLWHSYYKHPFVKGIGDGTLDIEKFKFYMLQDYLYLLDYAKVYALGVVKSDNEDVMKKFATLLDGILNGEMKIHKYYMNRLGISKEEIHNIKPSLANLSYSNYMLSVSQSGTLLDLSVSLLSCMWSYLKIGEHLNDIPESTEHEFYGEWIRGYNDEEYRKTTQWLIDLIDQLGENCSEKEKSKLKEIFINTSKYEYMFWDMAYKMEG